MNKSIIERGLSKIELTNYIRTQLDNFFPDKKIYIDDLKKNIPDALDRMLFSISHVKLIGYTEFNYLHSDLYAQFIYFLSNTIWVKSQNQNLAAKLFYLNKALHGLNCMYDTILPDIFLLIHSVGTVLGKAQYSNYFVACQNVTIGSDKGKSPGILGPLYMGPGSSVIGSSEIGEFTHLGIGACVLNTNVPAHSLIVANSEPKKPKRNLITEVYFNYDGD